ncbi:MAG: hypothetical protein AB7U92_12455 [Piscinibacter sp.]|uniref:hypothetical protein n=1 Tax=Piscinibacter sp. TaxID=1903157 RepID=UPI003D128736
MKPAALACAALFALLGLSPVRSAAAPIGIVTIADGELHVIRAAQRFAAAEGLRLHDGDIVRTGADTRLARIELGDGIALDLGASTELMLQPPADGRLGERATTLYLARGWLKASTAPAGAAGLASPLTDILHLDGSAVMHVSPEDALVFVESGQARVAESGRDGGALAMANGDALVRRAAEAASLERRPPAALLQGLPRGFADTLPRRAARFLGAPAEPGPAQPVAYAEVATWIDGEPAVRSMAVKRFAARARDRAFRAALLAGLRRHPEWDRTLFPEKYRPAPVVVVQRAPPQAVSLQGVMAWPDSAATESMETTR